MRGAGTLTARNAKKKKKLMSLSSRCKRIVPHIALVTAVVAYLVGGAFIFQRLELSSARRPSTTWYKENNPIGNGNVNPDVQRFIAFVRNNFPANLTLEIEAEMEQLIARFQTVFDVAIDQGEYLPTPKQVSVDVTYDDLILVTNITSSNITDSKPTVHSLPDIANKATVIRAVRSADHGNDSDLIDLESWDNLLAATLFAFTAVSTIGYGHLYPMTTEGRLFCILYTMIGIPLFMITVADIGKFIWEGFWSLLQCLRRRVCCRRSKKAGDEEEEEEEASLLVTAPLLLVAFVGYIALGAFLLPQWETLGFIDASYFAFISVSTVGFGDIVPRNSKFVIPTMIYIFVGLSLTTLAVEVLAAGFRQIHYVGRPINGAKSAKLWLGSKLFTINDLVRSVGRELGVSEDQVLRLNANIDLMLEEAAEEIEQRGRIDMPHARSRTPSSVKGKTPLPDDTLSNRGESPRFSGQYDNIPETWGNGLDMPFADHDETRQKLLTSAGNTPILSAMR